MAGIVPGDCSCIPVNRKIIMDQEKFNMSLRKFLKEVGVTSQQKIEQAVRDAGMEGGTIEMRMELTAEKIGLKHVVEGRIDLG